MLRSLGLLVAFAPAAQADILRVGPQGSGLPYTSIQVAVDSAAPGDLILVATGRYIESVVIDLPLTLMAGDGEVFPLVHDVLVEGTLALIDVALGEELVVCGIQWTAAANSPALVVQDCAGIVRLCAGRFAGGEGTHTDTVGMDGGHGARIEDSLGVSLVDCELRGGRGGGQAITLLQAGDGGHGLIASGSPVALYECDLRGGDGGHGGFFAGNTAGDGGDGCRVESVGVFASGGQMRGGWGGTATHSGAGGDGIRVEPGAGARLLDVELGGGIGGDYGGRDGVPSSGGGIVIELEGTARSIHAPTLVPAGSMITIVVEGEPGDVAWLFASALADHRPATAFDGFWLARPPHFNARLPHRVLTGSGSAGTATFAWKVPSLAAGDDFATLHVQALVLGGTGRVRLASARPIVSSD